MHSNYVVDTILFIIVDVLIYGVLVYMFHMDWTVAFFLSTALTFGIWYAGYYLMGGK